jgi:DNA topoisomerase-1
MARSLVIVESPAKAKTINKFLGREYSVKASMGHVRDLPKRKLGVDEETFEPEYTVLADKKKTLADLKKAAAGASAVYLASDPDREGEAICWHLKEELEKSTDASFHRVLFHEITRRAVREAFEHAGDIDQNKVDAQQARRILDRLVGYKISPLLWDKVRRGLSAGRVQSVALRIICEREREIRAFVSREYWSLAARLAADEPPEFSARLFAADGKKTELASRGDVEATLGELGWRISRVEPVADGPEGAITVQVEAASADAVPFRVARVQRKEKKKNPLPPFITSKLQQDASRQLGFPVSKTMRVAQRLYEGVEIGEAGNVGLITYMRTDSTRVSDEAVTAVREYIGATYGAEALPDKPRSFRSGKRAQEAHEAIRPTDMANTPDSVRDHLASDELRLYTLIWNRFVASQMAVAVFDTTSADVEAGPLVFRATGSILKSPGWLAVYHESRDEDATGRDDEEGEDEEDRRLPPLEEGQEVRLVTLEPRQHFTQPPPRFSEATLVRELEENGIGRPSTYATILSTIQNRDYVEKEKKRFQPTELGLLVNDLLVASFGDIVDVGYTARMEEELDRVEEGDLRWVEALREFQKKFESDLERARTEMRDVKREAIPTDQVCEKCGKTMVLKWGRFGQFIACSGYPECKNTRDLSPTGEPDTSDRSMPAAAKVAKVKAEPDPIEAEADPCEKCGRPMVLRRGRFGPFLACSGYPECKTTRKVAISSEGKAEAKPDVLLDESCPKCNSQLAIKHGRFGEFTACSKYPKCRYVKMKRTGVDCPSCGEGHLVERRSRRGKVFYGCDQYPDCDFVVWRRPVARPCPSCNRPYLLERITKRWGHQLVCDNDDCKHVEVVEAAPEVARA